MGHPRLQKWYRFWMKVDMREGEDCWPWRGAIDSGGYGDFRVDGRTEEAHRLAYEYIKGDIPEGLVIDHLCRNRSCVNPFHMEAVTDGVNILRGVGKSAFHARRTECANGHPFDTINTVYIKRYGKDAAKAPYRGCRKCLADRDAAKAKKKSTGAEFVV